jgi:L-lactate dehydrogenase complex protein LldG
MTAREEILTRIRAANGTASSAEQPDDAWHALPRAYNAIARLQPYATLDLLEERLRDYDATVVRCSAAEVAVTIERMLSRAAVQRILVPPGLPPAWLTPTLQFTPDDAFSAPELDRFDAVLTASTLAIAETGTVVLQTVPGQGRRAVSLVPDYHLCVVKATEVVETVSQAMARLDPTRDLPTTFVSGPSATADIEMTRIKGVHGPRILEVILVV